MIGHKIYFERQTGDVILTVPEKHNSNATSTTKEQDFLLFDVLQYRDAETVDFIQLPYGQFRGDFQTANSCKVDIETNQLVFEYPSYETPLTVRISQLEIENSLQKEENELLRQAQSDQDEIIMQLLLGGM